MFGSKITSKVIAQQPFVALTMIFHLKLQQSHRIFFVELILHFQLLFGVLHDPHLIQSQSGDRYHHHQPTQQLMKGSSTIPMVLNYKL